MQIAPSFQTSAPFSRTAPLATFVDVDLAASLLRNFLTALDTDDAAQRDSFMNFARAKAEHQLAAWGVSR